MFIGHVPANYLAACAADSATSSTFLKPFRSLAFNMFVLAGMIPDLDMIYFYLLDNRSHHHHLYWTHIPFCWLILYAVCCLIALLRKSRKLFIASTAFFLGILLHLLLDTPMGGVAWDYPLSSALHYWTTVPARYDWWVWNFLFHWTFISELVICSIAFVVFLRRRSKQQTQQQEATKS